jgi:flagellin
MMQRTNRMPVRHVAVVWLVTVFAVSGSAIAQSWRALRPAGLGDLNSAGVGTTIVFISMLYVGTWNSITGTEVWRYDGSIWTRLISGGFGDADNRHPTRMTVVDRSSLVGTCRTLAPGGEFWSYDGSAWAQINVDGFGDPDNEGVSGLSVHNGLLYAGTYGRFTGTEIWTCSGSSWTQVSTGGFGSANNHSIQAAFVHDGALYPGT